MKKTLLISVLVVGLGVGFTGHNAAQGAERFTVNPNMGNAANWNSGTTWPYNTPGPGATVCKTYARQGWGTVGLSWLLGRRVSSPAGGDLGQIGDLLIDRSDGHVVLVILSEVPGLNAGVVAVPPSAFERISENAIQLNFGDQDIPVAPFPQDRYAWHLANSRVVQLFEIPVGIYRAWLDRVYAFYGQTPHWAKAYWAKAEAPEASLSVYSACPPSIALPFLRTVGPLALMGAPVQSEDQRVVARIKNLIVEVKTGVVILLVLDQVSGADSEKAVPFSMVASNGKNLVLQTTQDKLAQAPRFDENTDFNNPKWAEEDYLFFGQQPSWQ